MKEQNFLANYVKYTAGNEAPELYHLWSGCVALSSIVSRKVWIDMGYFQVYPNIYVVLLGAAGNKKTTSMNIAKALVRDMKDIPFVAEAQTKESLVREFATYERQFKHEEKTILYTPITIFSTELSHLLGPNSKHMIDFLVTAYDIPVYDCRTKNKGNDLINGPYVTLLGCTTPSWITGYLKEDIISGGFTRRAIFVYVLEEDKRIAFPEVTSAMQTAWNEVIAHAAMIKEVKGPFVWCPVAKKYYKDWYETYKLPDDESVRGYFRTKPIQVLKTAMLVSLSEGPVLKMEKHHLEIAMSLLEQAEVNLSRVFGGFARNELFGVATKMLDFLQASPDPVPEKRLTAMFYREANGQELFNVLLHLERTEKIVRLRKVENGVERVLITTKEKGVALLNKPLEKKP